MNFVKTNPRKDGKKIGDCMIRATSLATNINYDLVMEVFLSIGWGHGKGNKNSWLLNKALDLLGVEYDFFDLDNEGESSVSLHDWVHVCNDNYDNSTFIFGVPNHVACVKNGVLYDSWNCWSKKPNRCFNIL
jgi:hypothetical protein